MKNKAVALLLTFLLIPVFVYSCSSYVEVTMEGNCMPHYSSAQCYEGSSGCCRHFLPSEKCLRRQLYWLYNHNPHYLELANFPVDYFLTIVAEHIKGLESKIAAKKNGLRSNAIVRAGIASAISALWGSIAHDTYAKRFRSVDPQEAVVAAVILGGVSGLLAVIAGTQFYKAYCYAERLVERLDRDKRIFAFLERVKIDQGDNAAVGAFVPAYPMFYGNMSY